MNFRDITERLSAHGSHSLWLLDPNDQVRQISFAELHRRAEEAVRALAARGVTADMRVGILAENSLEWIVYDLAMLVIGCTSVAFPREVAAESWPELFDRYDLSLMLVAADEQLPLDVLRGRVHVIDGPSPSAEPALPPRRARAPEVQAPALIFSSGSTGRAKCMIVNPGGVWFVIDYLRDLYSLNQNDRLLIFLPFSHYQQRGMVYAGIWLGMDLAMVAPKQLFAGFRQLAPTLCVGPPLLYETIYAQFHNRVEKLPAPARQAFRMLTAVPRRLPEGRLRRRAQRLAYGGIHKALGGAMRAMITGAAPIKRDVLEFFNEAGIGLYEGYGTGETGLITANAMDGNRIGSVGKPPPVGETRLAEDGEIIVGNRDFAATGYLHIDTGGERVELFDAQYATGDIGRFDEDGYLYLVGRKREIIITSSGVKIHPEVVEARLAHHHMVERVAVFGSDQPYLVAVIVPRVKGDAAVEAAIREHAQAVNQTLNVGTQVGRVIFSPESFTYDNGLLTRTLKLDRRGIFRRFEPEARGAGTGELVTRVGAAAAAAAATATATAADGTYAAPRTDVERALAGLWSELLGVERISIHDDFFARGGNSLLALQVASHAQRAGLHLEARQLFDHPTIATLAAALAAAPASGGAAAARRAWPEIAATERVPGRAVPLSLAQQRIWFLQRFDETSSAYNIPVALRLVGPLDIAALARGFQLVVERHEILRTAFPERDGRPVQEIAAAGPVLLEAIDLTGLPREAALEEARRRGREEARRPFELGQGAPWRAQVLRLGAEEHVLLLTLHHVAADGWSIPIFMRELAAGYEHARRGGEGPAPGLAPLAVQYADVAIWQQEVLVPRLAPQVEYWKEALAEAPPALELFTDRPRPAVQSYAGGAAPLIVDEELTAKLEALGRAHKATLFMVLQSAWAVLLSRYSGQERVVVGVPVANRTQMALEPLIGMFVNTLVLHNDLRGQPSFAEVLARGRAMVLGAFEHADVPFEQLVEVLQPVRDMSRNPLFQASFTMEYEWTARPTLPGLKVTSLYESADRTQQVAQFDLSLVLVRTPGGGLEGELGYSTALFERATIERLVRQYRELLRAVVAGPRTAVGALGLSDEAERRELAAWNATDTELGGGLLHELVGAQAARTPERVAAIFEGQQLTYGALLARADQLAHHLRGLGVGPDVVVAVLLERSVELVVALLGILRAGGAYLPLDPEYPAERLAFTLRDAGALVLVTTQPLAPRIPTPGTRLLCLDADEARIGAEPSSVPASGCTPDHLAYVLYTSGSTGKPNAVIVSHRSILNRLQWHQRRFPLAPGDKVLHKTPCTFDVSVWEVLWPLVHGGALVIARPGGHQEPRYLAQLIADHGISCAHFVPSMLRALLENLSDCGEDRRWPALTWIFCSGEVLSPELARLCFARLGPGTELHNLYGPTEAAVDVTHWHHRPRDTSALVPIGRPVANTKIHILDGESRPVAVGVPGELYIGGIQVARGYLGRPELTAQRFVPDPFSAAPGARMYRTGDRARYRTVGDGAIEFLGRLDFQVKLRGIRIELGEIEAALREISGIRDAVVIVHDERLAAYLVPGEGEALPSREALRGALGARLPVHMVPHWFIALPELPLTTSGKLARKALPAPDAEIRLGGEQAHVAPRTESERALAAIWSELLGVEQLGVHDDFFALGGHSLLVLQVISRAQRAGLHLEVRQIFEHPTVAALAAAAGGTRVEAVGAARRAWPPIVATERAPGRAVPLSLAQQRIWFLQRFDETSSAYNIPVALRLVGPLEVAALARGLQAVVERHEILRTAFPEREGRPVQEIAAAGPVALEVIDLTGLPREARLGEARRRAGEAARRPFELAQGAPWRAQVLRLGAEEHVLLLTLHHVVADGWSIPILMRELAAGYEHARRGGEGPVPGLAPLAVQYADVAIWQQEVLVPDLGPQVEYWKQALAEAPPALELLADRPRPAVQSHAGGAVPLVVDEELTAKLEALGRARGATLFMVLQSAWAVLLSRYSGQARVVVGVPVANRTQVALEPLIGMFVNTLVLHNDLRGQPSFAEVLARGRAMVLGAFEHADVPFEQLVEVLQPVRDLSRNPLFQASFALEYEWTARPTLPGVEVLPLYDSEERAPRVAQFDLGLVLVRTPGGGLAGELGYSTALFERATIERLVRQYRELLRAVVAAPQVAVGALGLSDEAERRELAAWNAAGAAAVPPPSCIHEQIAAQAVRRPDAVAVSFGDEHLTYAELQQRAGQLAHRLRALGVGPDARVGLCVERSLDMVLGMLAILMAGGAYLPLDPSYPRERLTFMLEDAGARVLVTQHHLAGVLAVPRLHTVLLPTSQQVPLEPVAPLGPLGPLPPAGVTPEHLAYVIYTSGSTGTPKGVMVPHATVSSFFAAMDRRLGDARSGVWLAITSISFDISVLELLWTLARGFHVVVHGDEGARRPRPRRQRARGAARQLELSLFYFANDAEQGGDDRYRLLLEGARFADEHGFAAVWTPERHFHAFGGLYPNPSVVGAALAVMTRRIGIRAGSVVLPLHHPVRIAEEWALVDNLSRGRVGISFASGWHADDFVFAPNAYSNRRERMLEGIDQVRRLWRGERLSFANGVGQAREVEIRPRPIQAELPFWLTAAGNPETFRSAGRLGANVLTHLLGQSAEDLRRNIAIYREAWQAAGHRGAGHVTLMLHTFVHADAAHVRARVDGPFRSYLASSADLMRNLGRSLGMDVDAVSPEDLSRLIDHAFDRYFETSGLFGTPRELRERAAELHDLGVDELGCLIDFGIDADIVLESLPHLDELRRLVERDGLATVQATVAEQIHRHGVTHLQCTPSFARTLIAEPASVAALGRLSRLLVGGEALPAALASTLCQAVPDGEVLNMYGPTETTIWSSTHRIQRDALMSPVVSIGRGIEGTRLYVLDQHQQPVPVGAPGELYIGGLGVVRGYLGRPELTAERFVSDPFRSAAGARMYRTGDRVRWRADGTLEFLGRVDHQLKVRGFRIEPGEIEAVLESHPGVRQAVVVVREDEPGDVRLVGYVVTDEPAPEAAALRGYLQQRLPEPMVPSALVTLAALPLTPNGKVDRKALPAPTVTRSTHAAFVAPRRPLELQLAEIWQQVLGIDRVGVHDDFFTLGGHSLLVLQVVSGARRAGLHLEVRQLFEHPTIAGLAAALASAPAASGAAQQPVSAGPAGEDDLPLTPNQRWFTETFDAEHHLWAMSLVWQVPAGPRLDLEPLRAAAARVIAHHDALRLRLYRGDRGWAQRLVPTAEARVEEHDLGSLNPDARRQAILEAAGRLQDVVSIVHGPVLAMALCRMGGEPDKLIIAIHHSVYDFYSLDLLMDDFLFAYARLGAGQEPELPPVPTDYRQYLRAVASHGRSSAMEQERAFWLDAARLRPVPPLPVDMPGGRHTYRNSRSHAVRLDVELVDAIRAWLTAHPENNLNELLLFGLVRAYARWTGAESLRLDIEHNGRMGVLPGVDLARTIGPTTVKVPVLFELRPETPPEQAFGQVQRTLRETMDHVLGFGLLRYGEDQAAREQLGAIDSPQVFFNNHGMTTGRAPTAQGAFEQFIPRTDGEVSYDLMVECGNTPEGPTVTWVYSSALHRPETIAALADGTIEQIHGLLRSAGAAM